MIEPIGLASKSPRRSELLARLGVPFEVIENRVEEIRASEESPADYVLRLAREKAFAGSQHSGLITIGADTIGVIDDCVLEKPYDRDDAFTMWDRMGGRWHDILTAVAVSDSNRTEAVLVTSRVRFANMSTAEKDAYWQTGEPKDKAGGYGIQGVGGVFVEQIEGVYDAVVGLPLHETMKLLREFNVKVMGE